MTAHPVSPILLDREQAWQVIDAQRLGLAGLLADLSEREWQQPSLCDGWTVRDVAAHLTLQQLSARAAIAMMLRYRGDTDRASASAPASALQPCQPGRSSPPFAPWPGRGGIISGSPTGKR